jgi:hypothetical protein
MGAAGWSSPLRGNAAKGGERAAARRRPTTADYSCMASWAAGGAYLGVRFGRPADSCAASQASSEWASYGYRAAAAYFWSGRRWKAGGRFLPAAA